MPNAPTPTDPTPKNPSPDSLQPLVQKAAHFISQHFPAPLRHAIILGTGAADVAAAIVPDAQIPFADIPGFPVSTALGHKGQLVCGTLNGTPVVAMQGRFHLYEGYDIDRATFPIHVMQALGIHYLFVSNASGGLNPNYQSGEVMLIDSHLDLLFRNHPNLAPPTHYSRPTQPSGRYDRQMIAEALACARKSNLTVHRGVYAAMLGPNYETRAEYRMLRTIGADAAGMSTVPEVTVAARYQMRVLGLSVISNVAKPDVLQSTSGQEVIDAAGLAAPTLLRLISNALVQNS